MLACFKHIETTKKKNTSMECATGSNSLEEKNGSSEGWAGDTNGKNLLQEIVSICTSNAAPSMCLSENEKLRKQDYRTTPKHEDISEVG